MLISEMEIRLRGDIARLQRDMNDARRVVGGAVDDMASAAARAKAALAGIGAGLSFASIGSEVVQAQREFDKLNASLVTATGSSANAAQAFKALQAFAATTPYSVAEATEAFIKMRNMGLDPSEKALRSYGNTAAAMGKGLNQMIEAVADAATGEFERLKEFGIKASQNGDQVALTFKGVTTTIGNDAAEIEAYLRKLGDVDFAGGMEQRAATLDGAISNLGDTWDATMRSIAQNGIGDAVASGARQAADALTDLQAILNAAAGAADKQGESMQKVGVLNAAATTVFEALTVLGVNVVYVLKQIGNEIAGIAAQATLVAKGEFAQARAVGQIMRAEAEQDRKEIEERSKAILGAAEKSRKAAASAAADKAALNRDDLARYGLEKNATEEAIAAARDLVEVRERLTGVNKQYMMDLARLQTAREKGAIGEREYVRLVSELATETYKSSEVGKQAAQASKAAASAAGSEATSYRNLITSIHEKIAANEQELAAGIGLSESQKLQIKFDEGLKSGKLKLTTAHKAAAQAKLDELAASEKQLKLDQAQREVAKYIGESVRARGEMTAALKVEYAMYGKSSDARAKAMVAVDAETWKEKELAKLRDEKKPVTDEIIAQLNEEAKARTEVGQATLMQAKALGYASQLAEENKRFGLDYIADDKARAAATLELDAQIWRERIALAGEGTEAQRKLQANFDQWYRNQSAKPYLDEQKRVWQSIESTAHDTFISIFDSGKSVFQRLTDTLKNGLLELLYQMTIKKWVLNIGASVGMSGGIAGVAQAGSSIGGISNAGSALSAASGLSGLANFGGSAIAGIGNLVGSSSVSAFGAGFAGNTAGMAMTASETFASAGMAAEASAASFGASVASAIPYVAALVAAYAIYKKLDDSGTYHTGGASYADSTGSRTIRAESIGFAQTRIAAETEKMTAGLVQGVVGILDSTALTFGKTAGYTAATAFADDTSKDGAWGSLVIKNSAGTVLDWNQTRNSGWAPREFADGQKGQEQYLAEMSRSVRAALDGIGLPSWAQTMLNALGSDAGLDEMAQVVQEINKTQNALKGIGQTMSVFANLSDGVASKLITAAGGIDALSNSAAAYYNAFYEESEKSAAAMAQVGNVLASVGISLPATKAEFRALVEANMALGEAGAKTVATLLSVSGAFAQIKDAVGEATTDLTSYRTAVTDAYNAEAEALQQTISRMGSFASSLRSLRDSALLGNLSPLSPQQKYAEAKSQYEAVLAAARGGDEKAQSNYQGAFTSFLEASRAVFASSDQFRRDFDYAQAATEEAARWAEAQVDVGQAQLDAIKASVVGIVDVKNEVMSLREALLRYNAAKAEQAAPVTAPAPAPIPYYPSEGRTNDAAAEALLYQIEGLRADLQQQTGDQIKAQAQAVADSAVVIAKAVVQPWKFKNDETRVSPE